MYKSSVPRAHFSVPLPQPVSVPMRSLTSEKKQLLLLVKDYLKKKSDRKTTLAGLTTLEKALAKSA
jgi:hypothetical protein